MEELVSLDLIDPNPYQVREKEDPEHVQKIADSIAADGLMQVPVGRLVDGTERVAQLDEALRGNTVEQLHHAGFRLQLAFGHSRLAAFRLLRAGRLDGAYARMPVVVRELSDEEMFRQGIGENLARKDLTMIEEAKAMVLYRDQFGKNSSEIGALFGLNESTVRGKMRLLDLPEEIRAQMEQITEGAARELLVLFDLPESLRERAGGHYFDDIKPSAIIKDALSGAGGEAIRGRVTRMIDNYSSDLSGAPWKHDEELAVEGMQSVTCKGCAFRLAREKKVFCLDRACYNLKSTVWQERYLQQASLLSGLRVNDSSGHEFRTWNEVERQKFAQIRGTGCENLGIVFSYTNHPDKEDPTTLTSIGFPYAEIRCRKRQGMCTCQRALEHGVMISQAEQPAAAVEGEEATPEQSPILRSGQAPTMAPRKLGPSAEDLREFEREVKRVKRQAVEEVKAMCGDVTKAFAEALEAGNPVVWQRLLRKLTYREPRSKSLADIRLDVAEELAKYIYSNDTGDPNPQVAFDYYNQALREAGLKTDFEHGYHGSGKEIASQARNDIEGVSVETVAPAGKTLVEVFGEEVVTEVAVEMGYLNGDTETLVLTSSGQLKLDDTIYGPDCDECGKPMPRQRVDPDGWTWYHCEKCNLFKGGE